MIVVLVIIIVLTGLAGYMAWAAMESSATAVRTSHDTLEVLAKRERQVEGMQRAIGTLHGTIGGLKADMETLGEEIAKRPVSRPRPQRPRPPTDTASIAARRATRTRAPRTTTPKDK